MTGAIWAAVGVIVAGVALLLLAIGWALGRDAQPWPGPDTHRGPVLAMLAGTVLMVGGFVWAVLLS